MIKTIASLFTVLALSTIALAGFNSLGATSRVDTVKSISDMRDDAKVTLEGYLVKQLSEEHYIFKDDTGEIKVEIDDEDFRGANVTPKIKVRIVGEVDKDWKTVSVDVDYLEIVE